LIDSIYLDFSQKKTGRKSNTKSMELLSRALLKDEWLYSKNIVVSELKVKKIFFN
jgi:hypothetical protein